MINVSQKTVNKIRNKLIKFVEKNHAKNNHDCVRKCLTLFQKTWKVTLETN